MKKQNRNKERIYLLVVSVVISLLFYNYYSNISTLLKDTNTAYDNKEALNLSADFSQEEFKDILKKGAYFDDKEYEDFITQALAEKLKTYKHLANLGQLNKKPFLVEAEEMKKQGGDWGRFRYLNSATKLGLDSILLANIDTKYAELPHQVSIEKENTGIRISGKVTVKKDKKSTPAPHVLVRLTEEITLAQQDSIKQSVLENASYEELQQIDIDNLVEKPTYYVRTDANGFYAFENLKKGKNYAVIPIGKGKEYGILKGKAEIEESAEINFNEKVHTLPLFDRYAYSRIKADKVFTVRTPDQFKKILWRSLIIFLIGFWVLHLAMSFKNKEYDQTILPTIMAITGIGLIILFSIQEPLRDSEFASISAIYTLSVLIFFSLFVLFFKKKWLNNIVKFNYLNTGFFKNIPSVKKLLAKDSRGFAWLLLSIVVMIILELFGSGPEGSGVKVNLGPIQVSEVAKFLMIIFFAKYFSANLNNFRHIPNNRWLIKHSLGLLIGFASLIVIYAKLGDLGPALVLCITFMIFYSLAKNEFTQMVFAGVGFIVLLFVINYFFSDYSNALFYFSILSIVALAVFALIQKRNESMLFLVSIISSFILIEKLPVDFAQRLADRNSMYKNIWANSLHGGDQVAQGVWSLDSGGLFGQGLGRGFSNVMPAYHTDMIFQSIGEELGIVSLILLLVLFGFLFFRAMIIARKTGDVMFFYLINGIAIATLIQLSIIVAGSLGLIPLTGISVPFLSKGNSSLLVNLFFFLVVLLLSQFKGKEYQMKNIQEKFDNLNVSVLLSFFAVILVFSFTLMRYWYKSDSDMVKPVMVLSKQGEWMYSENPRIKIFADKLTPGNIYDRNGILLATSDRNKFLEAEESVKNIANMDGYSKQKNSRLKRYYPFSEDLVYWLGDWNTQLVTNERLGYVADYRLLSVLRGFEDKEPKVMEVSSTEFKQAPYLPYETKVSKLVDYDREEFIPYMKAGMGSSLIEDYNKKNKDVKLSLDVRMQQTINKIIQNPKGIYKDHKISVVALNAKTGEVLASATNPRPSYKDIKKINSIPNKYYTKLFNAYFGYDHFVADRDFGIFEASSPGSTIKVVDALAYLKRDGADSAKVSFFVTGKEAIDVNKNGVSIEPLGNVDLHTAIVESSNVYFIRLLNEKNFDPDLFDLYHSVGIYLGKRKGRGSEKIGGYYISKGTDYDEIAITNEWKNIVNINRGVNYNNPKLLGTKERYFGSDLSFIAWGQGPIEATPLQMSRLYGSVAEQGKLSELKFVLEEKGNKIATEEPKQLIKNEGKVNNVEVTSVIEKAMKEQSKGITQKLGVTHYGKTGSPERKEYKYNPKTKERVSKTVTDAWYVTYIKDTKTGDPLVFAVRIKGVGNSGYAKRIWMEEIAPALKTEYFTQTKN